MIKGIIFDMDGVLIDSESFYFERRMSFLKKKGITPFTDNFHDYVGQTNQEIWINMIKDNTTLKTLLQKEYEQYSQIHAISFREALNEGVVEMMDELKRRGYKIAIASSSAKRMIANMIKEGGFTSCIDYYISGEDCSRSKPDPEIYNRAVEGLNLKKNECFSVEDSPLGIESAKAAGLYVLALKPKDYDLDQTKADKVILNFESILDFVK